jgi:type IV pilus assembly protein PilV
MLMRQPSIIGRAQARGFSLLEVMIAVVVFSIGLIGLGLLLTSSIRANHVGFLHSQATFVAESIADRMRANVVGVWLDDYDGTFDAATAAPASDCTAGSPCTPAELAARDTWAWGVLIGQLLPAGSGTITCTPQAGRPLPAAGVLLAVPTYSGSCTITVTWSEQSETQDGAVDGSFTWVVTP